ncbi:MAG: transglutaminase domain-containing protein, partial [Thaumarchaeota archaeon]|nr:transglutaminase domain-containing protein [Nitrososphaerota archaeon]
KLAIWVHNYITYDISLVGETKDASWVLKNKKGVCVEYATLFTAMSRSLGIPTKFVNGYSYSQFNNWLGHQWTEVYVGKWIPVDPTWLEVGHLDATHVESFKSYKRDQPNWVYAYLTNENGELQWESDLKFGGDANNVRINKVEFEKPLGIEIKSSSTQLNFGDKALIFVKIKSNDYRVVEFELLPCSGEPKIINAEESKKYAILRNNEELIIPWVIEVSTNLDSSYEYTCPVTVYSAYSGSNVFTLEAIAQKDGKTYFNTWLGKNVISLGEEQTIFYQPTEIARYSQIGYVYDYSESSKEVISEDSGSFTFKPKKLGLNKVYVYSTTGDVKELKFNVISNSSLLIKNVSVQNFVAIRSNASVNVTVANKAKTSAKVKLSVRVDENEATQLMDLTGEKTLNFNIPTSISGTRNVSISAEANDIKLEQNTVVSVYEIPDVKIQGIKYQSSGNKTKVLINIQTANEPKEISIKINNSEFTGKEGVNEIELIPGKYLVRVEWKDLGGKEYFLEQELEVRQQNALDNILNPCLPLLLLLGIIMVARRVL